jgi:uncharacterized protein (DUF305 family)
MQLLSLRTKFLALTVVVITSLTACSNPTQNQNQAENTSKSETTGKPTINHGSGMNHNHSMSMDLGPADADYDLRFIDGMTPHHQGAVEMAKEALQKSKRPEIKQLANDIIKSQNQEIEQMKKWRKGWYPKTGDKLMAYNAQMGHMMEMSSEQMKAMMMSTDLGAADADFDKRFIDAMIPHHEGAVTMAKDALSKSKRPEIKQLSQDILTSQQKEIDQMKQWRKAWYK